MNAIITRLGDYSLIWYQLRGEGATLVTADDTDPINLDAVEGDWASKFAEPVRLEGGTGNYNCVPQVAVNIPKTSGGKIRSIEIIGYGTTTANNDCDWKLYAYRAKESPVIRVAAGTAILGTMDTVTDPVTGADLTGFYVDTWGTTSDYWGSVSEKDDDDNACSRLTFDLRGYQYLYLEIKPTSGSATSFGAAFSGV